MEPSTARPALVITLLPLALVPACWLWWWAGGLNPSVQTGRSAALLLVFGACATTLFLRQRLAAPLAAAPLLIALVWQVVALGLWDPVPEPGLVWYTERATGLACAIGLAVWLHGCDLSRPIAAATVAGLGILAISCLAVYKDFGTQWCIGYAAPFGNVNFNVGAAMPLVALGISVCWWRGGTWLAVLIPTCLIVWLLGRGTLGSDPCIAIWLAAGTAVTTATILRLPPRTHLPILLLGGGVLVAGWIFVVTGCINVDHLSPGTAQRIHIAHAAAEAITTPMGLVGYGPAASLAILPEQPSFAASWLTVPSYLEHAHNEPLQVLLDGGLVLAVLLVWALALTIRPLWQQRHQAMPAALLVGWCTVGAQCLVESHLSQPGGVLCLAVLAGLSWSMAPLKPAPRISALLPGIAALALLAIVLHELAGDGGGPTGIETRAWIRINAAVARTNQATTNHHAVEHQQQLSIQLAELDRLRQRLGPLAELDRERAIRMIQLDRMDEAAVLIANNLGRLPVDPDLLRIADSMRKLGFSTPALAAAEAHARERAHHLLNIIRENACNQQALRQLSNIMNAVSQPDGPALAP